jgi:uncharacterized protein YegL
MRRLPIFFLIDISESMVGEQIQQVEEGLATIIQTLKTEPQAIETVWVSIIVFAGQPKTLVPLQEIVSFYPPKFPIGGGTSLSKGLGHLMFELRKNVIKTTYEQKGDWKPIVFLFTDGAPTDDTTAAIAEWKQNWARTANMVAVSFGNEADMSLLAQLTEHVLHFKNNDANAYKGFFKWITDSIKTSSESVENNGSGFGLSHIDGENISKIDVTKPLMPRTMIDDNYVVLTAICQNTKRPYLIKYKKTITPAGFDGYSTMSYRLVGGFQVDNSYFDLSYENAPRKQINTEELIGAPSCPCCGNQFSFAMCGCGNLHCIGDEEYSTCPWCNHVGKYTSGDGDSGFDVTRAQG